MSSEGHPSGCAEHASGAYATLGPIGIQSLFSSICSQAVWLDVPSGRLPQPTTACACDQ